MPSSFYPLNLEQADVDQIWDLGMTDGAAAIATSTQVADLSQYFMLKKKMDKRLRGGVSYDTFLDMKAAGDFDDVKDLFADKQMQAMFLQ